MAGGRRLPVLDIVLDMVLVIVLVVVLVPKGQAFLASRVPSGVSCMGAYCRGCTTLPIRNSRGQPVPIHQCVLVDFVGSDMAVLFTGVDEKGRVVIEKLIADESPREVTFYPEVDDSIQVTLSFNDINSVGNSMQVCSTLSGGIINNPPMVEAVLGCFVADTQTSTVRHTLLPRKDPFKPSAK